MKASKVFTSVNPGKAHALSSRNMDGPMLLCLLAATENLSRSPDLSAINGTSKMKKTLLKITECGCRSSMTSMAGMAMTKMMITTTQRSQHSLPSS